MKALDKGAILRMIRFRTLIALFTLFATWNPVFAQTGTSVECSDSIAIGDEPWLDGIIDSMTSLDCLNGCYTRIAVYCDEGDIVYALEAGNTCGDVPTVYYDEDGGVICQYGTIFGTDCEQSFLSGLVFIQEYWTCPNVNPCQSLVAGIVAPDAPVLCAGDTIVLIADTEGGTPPYEYAWGDGSTGESIEVVVEENSAIYLLTVIDSEGCAYTVTREFAVVDCEADSTDCNTCPTIYDPVCVASSSGDILTFSNDCFAICAGFEDADLTECNPTDTINCNACTDVYAPVCVETGGAVITFQNQCYALCAGYDESHWIDCVNDSSDCTTCPAIYAPVCVELNGTVMTFENSCFAICAGFEESDFIDCVNDSTGCDACPAVYDPVCVVAPFGEIITFSNSCFAICEGYDESDFIECVNDSTGCDACPAVYDPVCVATSGGTILVFQNACYAMCEGYDESHWFECDSNNVCSGLSATISISDHHICIGDSVVLSVTAVGGTPPYTYDWGATLGTDQTVIHYPTLPTQYLVSVTDANGCHISLTATVNVDLCVDDSLCTDTVNCVFPGDANTSLRVNNYDLLDIGFGFGMTGPARAEESIDPQFFPAPDWNTTGINGVNLKHADCNGDGAVNATDIHAIEHNYQLESDLAEPGTTTEPNITIGIEFNVDTILVGTNSGDTGTVIVQADLYVEQVNGLIPLYGLAFRINFEDGGVLLSDAYMEFDMESWLTAGNEEISFQRFLPDLNRLDLAISRTDRVPVTGSGRIGTLIMAIEDIIIGRTNDENIVVQAMVEDVIAVGNSEVPLSIGGEITEIVFAADETVTGVPDHLQKLIRIYPNPVQDVLYIDSDVAIQSIQVISFDGRTILNAPGGADEVSLAGIPAGNYVVKVVTADGVLVRKIIKGL